MNTKDLEQEVNQVLSKLMTAWGAGDGAAFASAFTEQADFVPYFGIHVQGRQGIANAHQPAFDSFLRGIETSLSTQEHPYDPGKCFHGAHPWHSPSRWRGRV